MAKKNVELASGRKIELKEMSVDEVDFWGVVVDGDPDPERLFIPADSELPLPPPAPSDEPELT